MTGKPLTRGFESRSLRHFFPSLPFWLSHVFAAREPKPIKIEKVASLLCPGRFPQGNCRVNVNSGPCLLFRYSHHITRRGYPCCLALLQISKFAANVSKLLICSIARKLQQGKYFFVAKRKSTNGSVPVLSVRNFPVDLRELINRTADHLKVERDTFIIELLRRDLKRVAEVFVEVDHRLEEIRQWWKSVEREKIE